MAEQKALSSDIKQKELQLQYAKEQQKFNNRYNSTFLTSFNPFTLKLIIQILLTIQEQMHEWSSENW